MKSFRTEMLACWFLAVVISPPALAGLPPPPVKDFTCVCTTAAGGKTLASLAWRNPPGIAGFFLLIRRDGQEVAFIQGVAGQVNQGFDDPGVPSGLHTYEVTVIDSQGIPSLPVSCVVDCPPVAGGRPAALIQGPRRLVMPPGGIAEAIFDGRASRDSRGGRGLQFQWLASDPASVKILSPSSFVTRAQFLQPGVHVLGLRVRETQPQGLEDFQSLDVQIVIPDQKEPAAFFPPPPDFLVAVAGKLFELPLMVVAGEPFPDLQVVNPLPGFVVDPAFAQIRWVPPIAAAGRKVLVEIRAVNAGAGQVLPLEIQVIDPAEPAVLYAFPLPPGGRDSPGVGAGAGDDAGGGGSLGPPPLFISDQAAVEPSLALELNPLAAAESCAVQLVTAGGVPSDPFDGLLFDPGCAGAGSAGLYASGSAGTKLLESVTNDFTIELWLSNISAAVPPGGRGFIFSMSSGTTDINWLVGHDGGETYTVVVRVNGIAESLSATASPRPDGLVYLVFVRAGDEHRIYVNGTRAVSRVVPHADAVVATWDTGYQVCLGNSSDETRPFDGRFHFAAIYGEALGDALIRFLSELGPKYPASADDVPAPIADICPDPREIRRGVEADGSLSRSGIGGGGGAGDGGGAAGGGCPDTLRPFEWTMTPSVSWSVSWSPQSGEEICYRSIRADYDPIPPGSRFDLGITLKVTQVPIRGITKTGTATKTIRLPTYFKRGDSNQDAAYDISDGILVLVSLYVTGTALACQDAADANDDGKLDTADAVHIFRSLFSGWPAPPAPFAECGPDPTTDGPSGGDLGCDAAPIYCS